MLMIGLLYRALGGGPGDPVGQAGLLVDILSTSWLPEREGPGVAGVISSSLGRPLLEPVHLQQSLPHERVGVHGPPGPVAILGLEGDQAPGPILEGATQVAG